MKQYTSYNPPSTIWHSPDFELGVIQILEVKESTLTDSEKEAVKRLRMSATSAPSTVNISSQLDTIDSTTKNSDYIDPSFIRATSNKVEGLFSRSKLTLECHRHTLDPSTFEKQLFLLYNRDFRDENTVRRIIIS
ncbi:hypothetical protein GEMRC1_011679 [Eukaryota sp. GEM-RC1]